MRLAAIAVVRDERETIRDFAGHLLALFDEALIVDHRSVDGTREYLQALAGLFPKLRLYVFDEPGHRQGRLVTFLAQNEVAPAPGTWVFPLDADEILPLRDAAALRRALTSHEAEAAIRMHWMNLAPLDLEAAGLAGRRCLIPPRPGPHRKIAFRRDRVPDGAFAVDQGNHRVFDLRGEGSEVPAALAFPLLHLPIRSAAQLRRKVERNIAAYRDYGEPHPEGWGEHMRWMLDVLATAEPDWELLAGLACRYSEPLPSNPRVSRAALEAAGYLQFTLSPAKIDLPSVDSLASTGAGPARRLLQDAATRRLSLG